MNRVHKLEIPSEPDRIIEVDEFAETRIESLAFSQDQRDDIAIAISEAVNNAIEHGNQGDASKRVHLEMEELEDGIRISVRDEGSGFNPKSVADPTDPDNLLAESGRGLLIIEHLMDEVNVVPSPKGTLIQMVKRYNNVAS